MAGCLARRPFRISRERWHNECLALVVINPTLHSTNFDLATADFWFRFINDRALQDCNDLEKLIAGCELIAAVDDLDLLAA